MEGKKLLATTPFPSLGDLLVMLGLFFVVQASCSLIGMLALLFTGRGLNDLTPNELGGYLAITSLVAMSLVALFFLAYRRWRGATPIAWGLKPKPFAPQLILWGFLLMAAAGIILEPLYELLPPLNQEVGRGLWSIVALVVIAPLFEEFLCRGLLYGSLRTRYNTTRSILLSALFFGILHLQPSAMINAFLMGALLAWIYEQTKTLWAPILLHAMNNAAAYLMLITGLDDKGLHEVVGDGWLYPTLWIVSLGVVLIAIFFLGKLRKKGSPEGENEPKM